MKTHKNFIVRAYKELVDFFHWRRERNQPGFILLDELTSFFHGYDYVLFAKTNRERESIDELIALYKTEYEKEYSELKYVLYEEISDRIAKNNELILKRTDDFILSYYKKIGRDLLEDTKTCKEWLKTSKYYRNHNMEMGKLAEMLSRSPIYQSMDDIIK